MIVGDLAKNSLQFRAATLNGEVKFCRKLAQAQFLSFISAQPPAVVVMEACGGAMGARMRLLDADLLGGLSPARR
jgi:hypothetical protein